ncbi:MAG: hypothetical protein O7J95_13545 [Planctomycetota bacterium]|nr:hypothetical protein [Planctomycetota bacterium]
MRRVLVIAALSVSGSISGCTHGRLGVEPSEYALTPEVMSYLDRLASSPGEAMDVEPVPYVSEGQSTHRFEQSGRWVLLYLGLEQLGRLDDGYVYQEVDAVVPVAIGLKTHLYGEDGKKRATRQAGLVGFFFPYPVIDVASFHYESTTAAEKEDSSWDCGFRLLRLPWTETSLLRLSTSGIDVLFLPLWKKDRGKTGKKDRDEKMGTVTVFPCDKKKR